MHYSIQNLNSIQQQAIETTQGAVLLLSGAGTGKTKVLTSRVVYIIDKKLANPKEILAVTFTNKAANEIKNRIAQATLKPADGFWIGTFHSIGLRILRRHFAQVGLKEHFTIIDMGDAEKLIKEILLLNNVDTSKHSASMVSNLISKLKDKGLEPDNIGHLDNKQIGSTFLSNIYLQYQTRLKELNCVDFGDLLFLCIKLFKQFPDVLSLWQSQFKYILVDEYQDTNSIQYLFVKLLSVKYGNIFCVGDDDQSIYSWRGAEIENILRFEKDFTNALVLRMEQNYRSKAYILKLASSLIKNNLSRYSKTVWSDQETQQKATVKEHISPTYEANWICQEAQKLNQQGINYQDTAVLIRAMHQSREIEEQFIKQNIPYRIVGSAKFYERAEIKDMIAYIRLIVQPYDDLAYLRIINSPKRGIGESSINKIKDYAKQQSLSLLLASQQLANEIFDSKTVSTKIKNQLVTFTSLFNNIKNHKANLSLGNLLMQIAQDSGYLDYLKNENLEENKTRIDNIKELANSMENYENLEEFLEHISLVNDKDEETKENKLTIMTLHAAKGLEFEAVFLPGFEEGIIPSQRSVQENGNQGLEEERRLAYVGITRAKSMLFISYCTTRRLFGSTQGAIASRFVEEMDSNYLTFVKNTYQQNSAQLFNNHYNKFGGNASFGKENLYSFDSHFESPQIYVGTQVNHTDLGDGTVQAISGNIVTVKFNSGSVAKVIATFLSVKNQHF